MLGVADVSLSPQYGIHRICRSLLFGKGRALREELDQREQEKREIDSIKSPFGGEEFLVLITHIEKENVAIAIERIRQKFEAQIFVFDGRTCPASASFGIAGFRGPEAPDFRELVARADAAL